MTEATKDFYLANFAQFAREVANNGQAWTQPMRQAAMARFAELGFPTTHNEEWKYTNVAPIARIAFQPAQRLATATAAEALAAAVIPALVCTQLVFVNGHYVPELSAQPALPDRTLISRLPARWEVSRREWPARR